MELKVNGLYAIRERPLSVIRIISFDNIQVIYQHILDRFNNIILTEEFKKHCMPVNKFYKRLNGIKE